MNPQHFPPPTSDPPPTGRAPVAHPLVARLAAVLAELRPANLVDLCIASNHAPVVTRARHDLILSRVWLLAAVLSVSTILWIAVDALTIPAPYWQEIALWRCVAGGVFLLLALRPHWLCLRGGPAVEVALLVAVPLAFFLQTNVVLHVSGTHGAVAIVTSYFYLPFVVAAALAIFPLTLLEALLPVSLVLGSLVLGIVLWPEYLRDESAGQTLWRLFVIAFWATLAGLSQLRFLLRLTEQATRDGLTNLLVRGTGEEILENQFAYAQRQDLPFAVLFVDIDRFKTINDEYGHDAGDAALRGVATQIARAFRHQDVMIRWGGEEFVVGLPGANLVNAEIAVLRLAKLGLGLRPDYQPITASIGIAERQADGIATLAALVERADSRMYEAKQAGRNRYVFQAGPKIWLAPTQDKQSAA